MQTCLNKTNARSAHTNIQSILLLRCCYSSIGYRGCLVSRFDTRTNTILAYYTAEIHKRSPIIGCVNEHFCFFFFNGPYFKPKQRSRSSCSLNIFNSSGLSEYRMQCALCVLCIYQHYTYIEYLQFRSKPLFSLQSPPTSLGAFFLQQTVVVSTAVVPVCENFLFYFYIYHTEYGVYFYKTS